MIAQAHAHGIRVIGATILPYGGSTYYHPGAENEADRQAVNAWIRDPGHLDGVVDFDLVTVTRRIIIVCCLRMIPGIDCILGRRDIRRWEMRSR